eukprot:3846647-Alexandrium_andersonii.AAC.1
MALAPGARAGKGGGAERRCSTPGGAPGRAAVVGGTEVGPDQTAQTMVPATVSVSVPVSVCLPA